MSYVDLTGRVFTRLTVLSFAGKNKHNKSLWLCKCECGKEVIKLGFNMLRQHTKSCGCYDKDKPYLNTHRLGKSKLYSVLANMKSRCYNPSKKGYKDYGAKGVTICEEWLNDFMAFKKWADSSGYKDNLTIERKDATGNYEPDNCKWVEPYEQHWNKRNTVRLLINAEMLTYRDISEKYNIPLWVIRRRYNKKLSIEEIIAPYKGKGKTR